MTSTSPSGAGERLDAGESVIQIHLEELGRHSGTTALLSALVAAAGGPQYRFVAVAAEPHEARDHVATGVNFPLEPFQELADQTHDNEWAALARRRLDEFDRDLADLGWRRRPERGPHWWSLRYDPGEEGDEAPTL